MGRRLTLILGGARSGKSDFAEALASERGGQDVLFIATAQGMDEEMQSRIQAHRAARSPGWTTVEAPIHVASALLSSRAAKVVLLDCLTLWTSNVLLSDELNAGQLMQREITGLVDWYNSSSSELAIVSNEVGMGLVPPYELGRKYRDLLGSINRQIAALADDVYLLVSGLPVELKSLARPWPGK